MLGSFISPDTLVPEPGQPEGYNRYAYANGNPLRFSDPSGHFTEEQLIEWYGENWRSRFSQSWQNLLLDSNGDQLGAQFGDVVEAAWGDNPKQQFVIVNGYNEMPALWHTSAKVAWDLAANGGAETSSLGLYRTVAGGMGFSDDNLLGASMRVRSGESLGRFGSARTLHLMQAYSTDSAAQTSLLPANWAIGNQDLGFFVATNLEFSGFDPVRFGTGILSAAGGSTTVAAFGKAIMSRGTVIKALGAALAELTAPAVIATGIATGIHDSLRLNAGYAIEPCPHFGLPYCR